MTNRRQRRSDIVWGKVSLSVAVVALSIAGAVGGDNRPWVVIIGSAMFMVAHTAVNTMRDQSVVRRLGQNYDQVQRRSVQIVSDLGQLASDEFGLWVVDIYLPERRWLATRRLPFVTCEWRLSRQLTVSLLDTRSPPPYVPASSGPLGESYKSAQPKFWFDERFNMASVGNLWGSYTDEVNFKLASTYGALAVAPLVDQVGKNCIGVLAIHVEPDPVKVISALGVISSQKGALRISNACVDLNRLLAR